MARKWNWKKKYGNLSVQQLLGLLKDDSFENKYIPIYILGELKAKEAVDDLIKILDFSENEVFGVEFESFAAIYALGKIKDKHAVEPLIKLLKNKTYDIISAAAWALGEIGDTRAIPALEEALIDDEFDYYWSTSSIPSIEDLAYDLCDSGGVGFVPIFRYIQDITFSDESSIDKSLRKLKKKK
ncbi:MAG: HEAT repeat domain-containing protein [Methanoregula sp.]|nr:HEAT repeat domain-containing protein [Methanoregula sp.]